MRAMSRDSLLKRMTAVGLVLALMSSMVWAALPQAAKAASKSEPRAMRFDRERFTQLSPAAS